MSDQQSHDGLSNLVLEALAYERYVLWTYPFPGAEAVDTVDVAETRIDELYRQHVEGRFPPNHDGRKAVLKCSSLRASRHTSSND